jgi:SAM-dependent methyltransferase
MEDGMTNLRPLDWPRIEVECDTTPDALSKMISRTEDGFSWLGEEEPYWSVLTDEKLRTAYINEERRADFYRSGHDNIETVLRILTRNSISTSGTAFELGCGLGRLTFPLARKFGSVIGADISASHLRMARVAAAEFNVSNVAWLHANNISAIDGIPEIDFFFSVIVLQHNPPPIIFMLLRRILSKLRPGGSAYFQVPTYIAGYRFRVDEYLGTEPKPIEMHCLSQVDVFRAVEIAGCRMIECREDSNAGNGNHILSNTFVVRRRA